MSIARPNSLILVCGWLCALLASAVAAAQTVTGTVSGTATDSSGAVVAGATITLVNERTGDVRKLTATEEGRFIFSAVQPGPYTIRVEAQGFQALEQKSIVLSANEDLALGQLVVRLGQVTETVTVTSGGNRVEVESSDLTARLTADQIALISTKGRDITSLLRTMPGMSYIDDIETVGEGFGTDLPNVSGQRGRSTVVTVDGLNASEPSGSNKLSMTINQDAIGEVKVLRNNYAAEYGNNGGAIINIVAKGGGREYHGSAYYFLRNEALNANNFVNNRSGLRRALYRHNIWGFNFGGPVQIPKIFPNHGRKKLFFFYSLERPHTITPQNTRFVTVPTALERQGDFSESFSGFDRRTGKPIPVFVRDPSITTGSCSATGNSACFRDPSRATPGNPLGLNIIPQAGWNSSGAAILNFFPLPNQLGGRAASGNSFNYVVQKSVDVPKWSHVLRVDFKPTENDAFYFKGQKWTSDNEGFQTSGWPGGDANQWGISSHYLYKDNGLAVNWVHIFNSRIVNEASVGLRHDTEGFIPSDGEIERLSRKTLNYKAPQLFPENNKLGTIPRATNWGGAAGTAANINWLDRWGEAGEDFILPSFTDNLSINRGKHSYKAGVYLERMRNGEAAGGNWSGTFNFSGTDSNFTAPRGNTSYAYANALLGNFRSYSESSSRPHTDLVRTMVQWYVQDQWKLNSRLTFNYGLRMGYHSHWFQRDRKAANFDPARFDAAKAPLLYSPFCVDNPPAIGTACPSNKQHAVDPRNLPDPDSSQLLDAKLVGSFVPGTGDLLNGLALGTDPATPKGFKAPVPIDWEPRAGFAWNIFGKGKTVLRAMGGVYHSPRVGGGTTGGNLVNNPPEQRTLTLEFSSIDRLVDLVGTALSTPTSANAVEVHSKTPTTYNFSLGVQQDIGFKTVVEISYVGSVSRHLGERRNINGVPDGARFLDLHPENRDPRTASSAKANNFLRPYQGFGDINMVMYSGTSNYNGLQVQVNRRYTRGLQYGVAYTWSKTLDHANDDSSDVVNTRPYREFTYGLADFDQTHIFTVNYIWDIPGLGRRFDRGVIKVILGGWQVSGITSLVTGKPKSVSVSYANTQNLTDPATGLRVSTDFTGGQVNARANMICNPNRRTGQVARDGTPVLIDTSCFASPTVRGDIGNTPRNVLRLPGVINFDLAIFKNIHINERATVQFRWETYNLFNHTNFRDIDAAMTFDVVKDPRTGELSRIQTNNRFGQPTSARSPRVMQGSLRFSF